MAKTFRKSDIKKALEGSGGIISVVAKRLRCDWHTARKYIDSFDLKQIEVNEKESLLDLAESNLIKNIQEQDNTAIIFYLKTQGKARGYVEKQEVVSANTNINTNVEPTEEQKKEAIERVLKGKNEFKDYE